MTTTYGTTTQNYIVIPVTTLTREDLSYRTRMSAIVFFCLFGPLSLFAVIYGAYLGAHKGDYTLMILGIAGVSLSSCSCYCWAKEKFFAKKTDCIDLCMIDCQRLC